MAEMLGRLRKDRLFILSIFGLFVTFVATVFVAKTTGELMPTVWVFACGVFVCFLAGFVAMIRANRD